MRRSGRINSASIPAFFTRSKAKNFFNTNSNAASNQNGNKQEQHDGEGAQPEKQQEQVVESAKKNSQTPKLKTELNEPQEAVPESKSSNNVINPLEVSDGNQNSVKESDPVQIEEEMKLEESQPRVFLKRENSFTSSNYQDKIVSATTKALARLKKDIYEKKNMKKKQKAPLSVRRRKLNERLNRILAPKSGLIFLHELKPGCSFRIQEQPGSNPPVFIAQVQYDDKVIAVGQGMTKPIAKNAAAENAIKVLVAEAFTQQAIRSENPGGKNVPKCSSNDSSTVDELMDTSDDLSLAGLASFAMYKMFTEWQSQGTDLPLFSFQPKKKVTVSKAPSVKKELPPNAEKLHPSFLLNTMRPGIMSTELERSSKDNVSFVTVGYEIDGKMYRGSGSNKKEARKRAAQAALTDLYGMKYDD